MNFLQAIKKHIATVQTVASIIGGVSAALYAFVEHFNKGNENGSK